MQQQQHHLSKSNAMNSKPSGKQQQQQQQQCSVQSLKLAGALRISYYNKSRGNQHQHLHLQSKVSSLSNSKAQSAGRVATAVIGICANSFTASVAGVLCTSSGKAKQTEQQQWLTSIPNSLSSSLPGYVLSAMTTHRVEMLCQFAS